MNEEEMLMNQECPYCLRSSRDDNSRDGYYGSRPYGYPPFYGYNYPYGYPYGYGHHSRYRDDQSNDRHDYGNACPDCGKQVVPMQPIVQPIEKNYSEFKSLEQNVNIIEINNTIVKIEKKHPYLMKKLLMLGLAEEECKKILYLTLLCSGKF